MNSDGSEKLLLSSNTYVYIAITQIFWHQLVKNKRVCFSFNFSIFYFLSRPFSQERVEVASWNYVISKTTFSVNFIIKKSPKRKVHQCNVWKSQSSVYGTINGSEYFETGLSNVPYCFWKPIWKSAILSKPVLLLKRPSRIKNCPYLFAFSVI